MEWPISIELKVPWRDIDAAGHVNNAVYFSYMETARTEAFLKLRGGKGPQHVDIILARAEADFRAPAAMGDVLVVSVRPTRVGESSFAFRYEIREKTTGRLMVEGASVQVMFDYEKQQKKPIPADVKAALLDGVKSSG